MADADGVKAGVKAIYNQATNDRAGYPGYDPKTRWSVAARASNYGMEPTIARMYNTGIHVVDSAKYGLEGANAGGAHVGGTRYSTAVEAPTGILDQLKDYR